MGMHNAAAAHIAMRLGLGGAATTSAVACASSAIALGEALRLIRHGEADIVVAGGSEAPLTAGMLLAWDAMRVLARGEGDAAASACRPFSADRAGLVLGEGGAALVLEPYERAQQRGARIYAELAGYGASCDHHHLAQPLAAGQVRALRAALDDAKLATDELDYVNAHGTGTVEGDPVEIDALRQVLRPARRDGCGQFDQVDAGPHVRRHRGGRGADYCVGAGASNRCHRPRIWTRSTRPARACVMWSAWDRTCRCAPRCPVRSRSAAPTLSSHSGATRPRIRVLPSTTLTHPMQAQSIEPLMLPLDTEAAIGRRRRALAGRGGLRPACSGWPSAGASDRRARGGGLCSGRYGSARRGQWFR